MEPIRDSIIDYILAGKFRQLTATTNLAEILSEKDSNKGRTVLIEVAEVRCPHRSYSRCIELILKMGADPAAAELNGDTAAHLAARTGNLRMLAPLPFKAKFLKNHRDYTPLMEAVQKCQFGCVKHLLHLFRQPRYFDQKQYLLGLKSKQGMTAIDLAREISSDKNRSDMVAIIENEMTLLVTDESKITGRTNEQKQLFKKMRSLAIEGNYIELQNVATRVHCDLPDKSGRTVLSWVAAANNNKLSQRSQNMEQTLHGLCMIGDPTAADVNGDTCLHFAALSGTVHTIKILIEQGVPVNARDAQNQTPMMWTAISQSQFKNTVLTLENLGADLTLKDSEGRTALWLSKTSTSNPALSAMIQSCISRSRQTTSPNQGNTAAPVSRLAASSEHIYHHNGTSPGLMVILNTCNYDDTQNFQRRVGSNTDVNSLKKMAGELSLKVVEAHDKTADEMRRSLDGWAKDTLELEQPGYFICVIMGHGENQKVIAKDGNSLLIEEIMKRFNSINCPALQHKPKVFIIQACRGGRMDICRPPTDAGPGGAASSSYCPVESDFLTCYATTEGSVAYRGNTEEEGSPFIQTLCNVIIEFHRTEHLLDMLTIVNQRLKQNPIKDQQSNYSYYAVSQTVTQLSKKLYLAPRMA